MTTKHTIPLAIGEKVSAEKDVWAKVHSLIVILAGDVKIGISLNKIETNMK